MKKEREENLFKKWNHYIHCVTQDIDEKDGVSADGWKTAELLLHYLIFLSGVWYRLHQHLL